MTVGANNDPLSNDSWVVTLTTPANIIPTGVLPQPAAFPPASAWVVPGEPMIDSAFLTVFLSGKGNYQLSDHRDRRLLRLDWPRRW